MRRFLLPLLSILLAACATAPHDGAAAAAAATPTPAGTAPRDPAEWEPTVQAWEADDARVRRMPGSVVFVGSSSIRLWTTLAEDFPGVATINRGYGSSRAYDSVYFADRIVNAYQPRAVVFYAGENDLHEGRTPRQVRDDFAAFVRKVQAATPKARIAFVSIKPSPSRAAIAPQVREANALIRDFARGVRGVDYLDVYTPMLGADGAPREELFVADRLHMNRAGYELWTGVIGRWLAKLPQKS
ncbi:hypothetical protein J5226_15620 [Lysobacter sp. K5869]|uniref:SGNH/GDSL hydrolase family protein n=1 Tax=Lysobacter sp. K5869 TaxID=2820808 RepID=UPI001C05FCB2|nr:SGNH/GDSL hydrolase family protein [Lysobacter sp. K5869]QWP75062.1 hypothetical protein J5226_15620 [Lysobacter sp. K5869]